LWRNIAETTVALVVSSSVCLSFLYLHVCVSPTPWYIFMYFTDNKFHENNCINSGIFVCCKDPPPLQTKISRINAIIFIKFLVGEIHKNVPVRTKFGRIRTKPVDILHWNAPAPVRFHQSCKWLAKVAFSESCRGIFTITYSRFSIIVYNLFVGLNMKDVSLEKIC